MSHLGHVPIEELDAAVELTRAQIRELQTQLHALEKELRRRYTEAVIRSKS